MVTRSVGNEFRHDEDIVVESFCDFDIHSVTALPVITIYNHPIDYPGKFVARISGIENCLPVHFKFIVLKDTIEEIKNCIPPYMVSIGRSDKDDPKIIECFI